MRISDWSSDVCSSDLLLRAFPGRSIVQLPQSLYYDDVLRIREMAEAIREHGAFTLLVSDAPSFAFAQRHFDCDVRLCPDAARYLGRFQRAAPKSDIFSLFDTDDEQKGMTSVREVGSQ